MWIICVDARYVGTEFYETFVKEDEANTKYEEFLEMYKEEISKDTVDVYFTKVEKSTDKNIK